MRIQSILTAQPSAPPAGELDLDHVKAAFAEIHISLPNLALGGLPPPAFEAMKLFGFDVIDTQAYVCRVEGHVTFAVANFNEDLVRVAVFDAGGALLAYGESDGASPISWQARN